MTNARRSTLLAACAALTAACGSGPGPPAAAPTFTPAEPLRFRTSLEVTLATTTTGATIHFTTDGSPPTPASPEYQGPITVTDTTTIKAIAAAPGMSVSPVAEATFPRRAVDLMVDDGSYEVQLTSHVQAGGYIGYLNRFTPAPDDYPFQLRTLSVVVGDAAGAPLRLVVFSDANGDPADGATLEATYDLTVQATLGWSVYALDPPVTLRGPGDVLIGRFGDEVVRVTLDTTASAGRTYRAGWWVSADAAGLDFSTADFFLPATPLPGQANAGNALIRGGN